jgi:mucin-19
MSPTLTPKTTPYYGGGQVVNPANVLQHVGVPSTAAVANALGTISVDNTNATAYMLVSLSGGTATWIDLGGGAGVFTTLNVTGLSTLAATTIVGTTNINVTGTAVTTIGNTTGGVSLVGATGVTGTLTASTGLTATTGNLTLSGTGSGFVTTPTVVTAGATPQTANGRIVQVTFSSVSIASGATQAFVINDTSITGSTTVVDVTWYGATAGSALSIASIVNAAGSCTITMTNGTSATMVTSVANITFICQVLN